MSLETAGLREVLGCVAVLGICVAAALIIAQAFGDTLSPVDVKIAASALVCGFFGAAALSGATLYAESGWDIVGFITTLCSVFAGATILLLIWSPQSASQLLIKVLFVSVVASVSLGFSTLLLSHARPEDTLLTSAIMYAVVVVVVVTAGIFVIAVLTLPATTTTGTLAPGVTSTSSLASDANTLRISVRAVTVCVVLFWAGILLLPILRRMNPAYSPVGGGIIMAPVVVDSNEEPPVQTHGEFPCCPGMQSASYVSTPGLVRASGDADGRVWLLHPGAAAWERVVTCPWCAHRYGPSL